MADKTTTPTSKVLSINFGSYVCELEGFKNPFRIIRAVVDYFGELADASPNENVFDLKPDVDHLQRLLIDSAGDPYVRIVEFEGGVRMRTLQDDAKQDGAKQEDAESLEGSEPEVTLDSEEPAEADADVHDINDGEVDVETEEASPLEALDDTKSDEIEDDSSADEDLKAEDATDDDGSADSDPIELLTEDQIAEPEAASSEDEVEAETEISELADDIDLDDMDVEELASMMADELPDEEDLALTDDDFAGDDNEDVAVDAPVVELVEDPEANSEDQIEPMILEADQEEPGEEPTVLEADQDEPGEEPTVLEADQDEPGEEPTVLEAGQDEPGEEPTVLEADQDEPGEEPTVLEADQDEPVPMIVDRETGLEAPLLEDEEPIVADGSDEPVIEGGEAEEPELGGDETEQTPVSLRLSEDEIAEKASVADPLQLTPQDATTDDVSDEVPVSLRVLSNEETDEEAVSLRNEPAKRSLRIIRTDEEEEAAADDGDYEEEAANDSELSAFARQMGAASLPELLEASAAYVTLVDNQQQFSRKTILQMVDDISDEKNYTAEARIKSFGKLLRSGKIMRVEGGQFAISQATRFNYESRM